MQIHQTATVTGKSSLVYDAPFYVLILECWSGGRYEACRIVLGTTEPTGADLLLFLDRLNFRKLPWSRAVPEPPPKAKKGYRAEMLADRKQGAARERKNANEERFRLRREKQKKRRRGKA